MILSSWDLVTVAPARITHNWEKDADPRPGASAPPLPVKPDEIVP